jgi:DNA-binding IclR family transcriptional regulator
VLQSVERAAQILRLLGDNGRQSASELAAAIGLGWATVHSLLQALVSTGLVQQDEDSERYGLGPALVYLGSRYLRADEVRVSAGRWASSLASETDRIVQVGTLHGLEVLIVNYVGRPQDSAYVSDLGSFFPAQTSAVGKVLLAHDHEALDSLFASGDHGQAAGDQASLRHELACVSAQGWAVGGGGIGAGEASVACPIVSRRGEVIAAIGAVGPPGQLLVSAGPRAELLHRVSTAALGVSRDLGARGW